MSRSDPSVTSPAEGPTTANTYRLSCTDCSFETTVEGDSYDALDVADAHQEEFEGTLSDHFVNFAMDGR